MNLTVLTPQDEVLRLECAGAATPTSKQMLGDPVQDALGPGCYARQALLNLERTSNINSTGVAALVRAHGNFEKAGGRLVLHSVPPLVSYVFKLLKLHSVLHIADDERAALQLLNRGKP